MLLKIILLGMLILDLFSGADAYAQALVKIPFPYSPINASSLPFMIAKDAKVSPRLGLSYDLKGDGDWIFNLSAGEYVTAIANTQSRTELSASRARIVAAADETRRRLERDLHDGIQQRLVSLALKARTIETMTPRPAGEMHGELSLLADGLGTALDELREISRGIHPAVLSEAGLGPALKTLARRSAIPVELHLSLGSRPAEHLQVAGYYIASEALTNTAKHAQASVITMRVDGRDGALTLSIRDDGIGGADPSRGSGIIGLRDRVEALGGTISVLSPPGHGTTLHVHLPAAPSAAPTAPRTAPPGATP